MQDRNQNCQRQSNQASWIGDASSSAWQIPGIRLPPFRHLNPTSSPTWYLRESYDPPFPPSTSWYHPHLNLPRLPCSASTAVSRSTPSTHFTMHQSLSINMNQPSQSFEELHNEQAYLQSLLQAETRKRNEFSRQIPLLQASLLEPDLPDRRKVKKQIGWFRHRLHETKKQERAILGSLGRLDYDIGCWMISNQIENERLYRMEEARQQSEMLSQIANNQNLGQMSLNLSSPASIPQRTGIAAGSQISWPPPMAYSPYPSTPMYWPQRPNDYFGYQWTASQLEPPPEAYFPPSYDYSPSNAPINITSGLSSNRVSPKTLTGQVPERPVSVSQRSVSLNNAEDVLDHMSTNSPYTVSSELSVRKSASLPSLLGCANFWELGHESCQDAPKHGDRMQN